MVGYDGRAFPYLFIVFLLLPSFITLPLSLTHTQTHTQTHTLTHIHTLVHEHTYTLLHENKQTSSAGGTGACFEYNADVTVECLGNCDTYEAEAQTKSTNFLMASIFLFSQKIPQIVWADCF